MLKVGDPADHLLAVETVGAPEIRLAGFVADGLGLTFAPLKAEAARHCDAVDENGLVFGEHPGIAVFLQHPVIVGLAVELILTQSRVGAADENREIPAFIPGAGADGVAGPPFDGQVAGLQSMNRVTSAARVNRRVVLPTPDFPKMTPLTPRRSAMRWSALMMGRPFMPQPPGCPETD